MCTICLAFIKILKQRLRLKITDKARYRMALTSAVRMAPEMIRNGAIVLAKKIVLDMLGIYMNYKTVEDLGELSEEYLHSVKKIQRFFRSKLDTYEERLNIRVEKLCEINKILIPNYMKREIVKEYMRRSHKRRSRANWINTPELLELIRSKA